MPSGPQLVSLIPIRNMNRAIKFYTKALGGKLHYRGRGQMRDSWAALRVAGAELWFIRPEKHEKRTLSYHTFLVKDIRRYVAKLKRAGVKFDKAEPMGKDSRIEGSIVFESFGASAFFKDTEGNLLMAWQNFPPM